MELIEKLNWRYAAKAMNGEKIAQEKVDNIIEAISLAPTSSGLQPFEVIEENFNHAAKQAYIAFSQAITAAAFEGVDSTPMEGFDPNALDEILGLKEKGLRSCVVLPLGYRDSEKDWLVNLKKVRKSKEDLVTVLD